VLATAIASGADAILTVNAVDFPRHVLAAEQLDRRDPDGFLWELWSRTPGRVEQIIADLHAEAERRAGGAVSLKALLKRNRLNRLAKAIGAPGVS
ncbi:MAG: RSP_2648 family PIN domain-containing protein, partial [Paracoccaceae bacterium]